jgi:hypothetical protein
MFDALLALKYAYHGSFDAAGQEFMHTAIGAQRSAPLGQFAWAAW